MDDGVSRADEGHRRDNDFVPLADAGGVECGVECGCRRDDGDSVASLCGMGHCFFQVGHVKGAAECLGEPFSAGVPVREAIHRVVERGHGKPSLAGERGSGGPVGRRSPGLWFID